ncbi:hypothetical protein CCY01nite_28620 [Chitinophaga cymbidii]|uniref:Uncharacterized protein n=1 Tax=Chitinophaga cymbidii TaxID=1096750 RepID=A0A512RLQ1_9BACT|nr:hypothetical protein CCY01nite_28620 [Chitinophaga cymbidii]
MEILVELMDNIMIADNAVVRVDLPGMAGPVEKRMLLYNVQDNVLVLNLPGMAGLLL